MPSPSTTAWISRLRAVAESAGPIDAGAFADELGNTRALDRLVLTRRTGQAPPPPAPNESPDVRLWRAALDPAIDAEQELAPLQSAARSNLDEGALVPRSLAPAVEVWTEIELASLHALTWIALARSSPALLDRALSCARWHVENTGPDNATNRPWALHLFVMLSEADGSVEANMMPRRCCTSARSTGEGPIGSAH